MSDVFDEIRTRCAEVTRLARFVTIDEPGLARFADELASEPWPEDDLDPAHHFEGDDETMLAFTFLLDAINFGSGWFPVLAKRDGMSGYRTVATACKERFERDGAPDARALGQATAESMATMLGQDASEPEVAELMTLFARAWRDFGAWLEASYEGRYDRAIEAARGSAARLVDALTEMPLYQDRARYGEIDVPFYKRAQITAADLNRAFPGKPWGTFRDLDRLTLFADNLVPHLLRCRGVLAYDEGLLARIDRGDRLEVGSPEEVEIRAVAVVAVERLVAALADRGRPTTAHALDGLLWNAGQAREIKAHPRHRARCAFY